MHNFVTDESFTDSSQQDLLDELELRCTTNVAPIRDASNTRTQARIEIRSANACDRDDVLSVMTNSEIRATTMTGIASRPVMVGSVFHLKFDRQVLDLAPTLAICDRCTMHSDTSFELRMRFTQAIGMDSK